MSTFNKVFRTAEGAVFTKISAAETESFTGNYITVINNKAVAVVNGQEVPMPEILFNEIGVEYHLVDFYAHGEKMAVRSILLHLMRTVLRLRTWLRTSTTPFLRRFWRRSIVIY